MTTSRIDEEFSFPKGSVIFQRGDQGDVMYLVASGQVRLLVGEGDHRAEVARLGPGEFFGELSLLSGAPRNATAEAVEDTRLLAIGRSAFGLMMQDDLDVVFRMMSTQGERLRQADLPIEAFVQRMSRLRIGLAALRRANQASGQASIAIRDIAADVKMSAETVHAVLHDFAQQGGGSTDGSNWTIGDGADVDRLLASLTRETEV